MHRNQGTELLRFFICVYLIVKSISSAKTSTSSSVGSSFLQCCLVIVAMDGFHRSFLRETANATFELLFRGSTSSPIFGFFLVQGTSRTSRGRRHSNCRVFWWRQDIDRWLRLSDWWLWLGVDDTVPQGHGQHLDSCWIQK